MNTQTSTPTEHYVLVADDHPIARRGIREIVQDFFPQVHIHEASNEAEVLSALPNHRWSIILLDVRMPDSDVLTIIQAVRSTLPLVPILILTAVTEVEYAIQTMKAGANGFIQKHRADDELRSAIAAVDRGETYLHPETTTEMANAVIEHRASLVHEKLSDREMEIFRQIASGLTVKEVGAALHISDKTVATHLARIRGKTGIKTYVAMARYAMRYGLVE